MDNGRPAALLLVVVGLLLQWSAAAQASAPPSVPPAAQNDTGASAFIVSIKGVSFEYIAAANGTYAVLNDTIVGGDPELIDGQTNLQPTFEACAASCSSYSGDQCIAVNWCDAAGCPVDANGDQVPLHSCQLLPSASARGAKGVLEIGRGNPRLGVGGVRILVEQPTEVPEGYTLFFAQSLQDVYEIHCNESFVPVGQCVLGDPLPALIDRCNAWPDCKAVVYGPLGWGKYRFPFGELKGTLGDPKAKLDPSRGNLNPVTYTFVKSSALPEDSSSSGGMSAGAVAGIAVGSAAAVTGVVLGALLIVRRRRQRGVIEFKLSGGLASSSGGDDEVVASWGKEREGSTKKMVAKLLSEAPSPQWAEIIIGRENIKFSMKSGRAVRLGVGASGTVYRGVLHGATPCAIKVFDFQEDSTIPRYFIQEAVMLRRLLHPNLVQLIGVTVTEGRGLLLMELMAGDLGKALREDSEANAGTPEERRFSWYNKGRLVALQIAAGLMYLHQQKVLHMDMKPGNVLLSRDGTAKIADVGFSRILQATHVSNLGNRIGTFNWCAPEVLLGGRATVASDVFSFGVVLWEICCGKEPVRGRITPLEVPLHCPAQVEELRERCMRMEPTERPTAAEVVKALRAALQSTAVSRSNTATEGGLEITESESGVVVVRPGPALASGGTATDVDVNVSGVSGQLASCPSDAAPPATTGLTPSASIGSLGAGGGAGGSRQISGSSSAVPPSPVSAPGKAEADMPDEGGLCPRVPHGVPERKLHPTPSSTSATDSVPASAAEVAPTAAVAAARRCIEINGPAVASPFEAAMAAAKRSAEINGPPAASPFAAAGAAAKRSVEINGPPVLSPFQSASVAKRGV